MPGGLTDTPAIPIKFPEFATVQARVASFHRWAASACPHTATVNPQTLAEAGFYHLPLPQQPDRCACFCCGEALHRWAKTDRPLAEHRRLWRHCPYARQAGAAAGSTPRGKKSAGMPFRRPGKQRRSPQRRQSTSTEPLEGNEDVEVCLLVQPADGEVDVAALPPGPPVESQVGNGGGDASGFRKRGAHEADREGDHEGHHAERRDVQSPSPAFPDGIEEEKPLIPKDGYRSLEGRLVTFHAWQALGTLCNERVNPTTLADAGFIHDPTAAEPDRCKCPRCGVALHCWLPRDYPVVAHRQAAPRCAFLVEEGVISSPSRSPVRPPLRKKKQICSPANVGSG